MAGAPLGNQNAKKTKPWADAIKRALARRDAEGKDGGLNSLADRLLDSCLAGDLAALRELGDRLDGKAAQAIVGGDEDEALRVITEIRNVIIDPKAA